MSNAFRVKNLEIQDPFFQQFALAIEVSFGEIFSMNIKLSSQKRKL